MYMKLISIIVGVIFFLMLIKGSIESGPWTILVLLFIIVSMIKDKKKKRRKKTSYKKRTQSIKNSKSIKKGNVNAFNDIELKPNNYKNSYASEPINQTEQFFQDKNALGQIRQMKTMTVGNVNSSSPITKAAKLFYLQGSFMDDFSDNYNINIPCENNAPTYNGLNIYQLRSYFSWRTFIRKNEFKPTQISYVYLYIYEVINKIGIKNDIDGLNKLLAIWQYYRKYDQKLDNYFPNWIKDYYIINNLKIDYKTLEEEFPIKIENNQKIIDEIMLGNYENKLEFYDEESDYHLLKSKIMEHKYSFIIEMIIPPIFKNLDRYFNMSGYSFNEVLFGSVERIDWEPFKWAIYYHNPIIADFSFTLDENEKYLKIKDNYYKEIFVKSPYHKSLMGYILKNIDITLRECFKISRSLKINNNMLDSVLNQDEKLYAFLINGKIIDIINITIKKYLIENKTQINNIISEKRKKNIIIDSEKFASIRESSNRVQEKLIVEEEKKELKPIIEEKKEEVINESEDIFENLIANLNSVELEFVKKIICLENRSNLLQFAKANNILYEIMIENINSKALELIGDNLIEDYGDEIIIYAEYIETLKEKLGGN